MTSGLVNASFSLPKWQAVKMIFFAPWDLPFFFTHTHFAYTDLDTNINKPNTEAAVELTDTSGLSQNSAKYLVEPSESTNQEILFE